MTYGIPWLDYAPGQAGPDWYRVCGLCGYVEVGSGR